MPNPAPQTDRELDRQCAEEVMRWKKSDEWYEGYFFQPNRSFTTDPAAWMQVVERMRALGWRVSIQDGSKTTWDVLFQRKETEQEGYSIHRSIGRALVLAALQAVRG